MRICPRCKNKSLRAETSVDGSCYERGFCVKCEGSWFNDPPKYLHEMPEDDAAEVEK